MRPVWYDRQGPAVIAAYATRHDRPAFAFWPMLFANITIRLLGVPVAAKQQAAEGLTAAARDGRTGHHDRHAGAT